MARERAPKGRTRNKSESTSGSKTAKRKSGWVKPDGTPLRKRKGEYFPDKEIDKHKPSAKRRYTEGNAFPRKDGDTRNSYGTGTSRSNDPERGNSENIRDKRETRPYEKRDRAEKSTYQRRSDSTRGRREDRSDEKPERSGSGFTQRNSEDKRESRPYEKRGRGEKSTYQRRADSTRDKREDRSGENSDRTTSDFTQRNSDEKRESRPYEKRGRGEKSTYQRRSDSTRDKREERSDENSARTGGDFTQRNSDEKRESRPYEKRDRGEKSMYQRRSDSTRDKRDDRSDDKSERPGNDFATRNSDKKRESRPYEKRDRVEKSTYSRGSRDTRGKRDSSPYEKRNRSGKDNFKKFDRKKTGSTTGYSRQETQTGAVRLNKFIANAGICSRREADDLITAGVISLNGNIVTELGTKVMPGDVVKYHDRALKTEKLVYVLLNKPKDYITTTDDPGERKTVMNLISDAGKERLFPVGRLDRNTTGLLLITNDGELTKRLTHPSSNITKIYQVELDRNIGREDMIRATEGVELEDGLAAVDEIQYATPDAKNIVGVELHSGRNRVVRRIFESMDYRVLKLDRVSFAGLTKKDLPRGRWRFLTEMEVNMLKMLTGKKKNQ